MDNLERFAENTQRWLKFCPEATHLFQYADSENDQIVESLETEVKGWGDKLDYSSFNLLYVYGISDSAPYKVLKEWCSTWNISPPLRQCSQRSLCSTWNSVSAKSKIWLVKSLACKKPL